MSPVSWPLPEGNPRVLLAVGRLVEQKGLDHAIECIASVAQRLNNWDLVILGEGPESKRLEAQRDVRGLTEWVHLPGHVGNLAD